jgi:hypothetical protein
VSRRALKQQRRSHSVITHSLARCRVSWLLTGAKRSRLTAGTEHMLGKS